MNYLVDSDRVADYLHGYRATVDLPTRLQPDGLAISAVT